MEVFEFDDYKKFVRKWVKLRPKAGRGVFKLMAEHLRTNATSVSLIFNGDRELSLEQARDLCEFFQFATLESKYFIALVSQAKAGSDKLSKFYSEELASIKEKSNLLSERLSHQKVFSEQDQATFYSHWLYSAVRLYAATERFHDSDQIATALKVERAKVKQVLEFLLRTGACAIVDGKLTFGTQRTHIERDSLLVTRHHLNWRHKAMNKFEHADHDSEYFLTFPMAIAKRDIRKIRQEILELVSRVNTIIDSSDAEECVCLNLDWFGF